MKTTSYVLLFLGLCLCLACKKRPDCVIDYVDIRTNGENNLLGRELEDTLSLFLHFPQAPINRNNQEAYDLTDADPTFALYIREYNEPERSWLQYPTAKSLFGIEVVSGEELSDAVTLFGSFNQNQKIILRPQLQQGNYSIEVNLIPTRPGTYFCYWEVINNQQLLEPNERVEPDPCLDFISFQINNSGTSNIAIAATNSALDKQEEWIDERGLLFFEVR